MVLTTRLHSHYTAFAPFGAGFRGVQRGSSAHVSARANLRHMEHEPTDTTESVDDITTRALAKARHEFEQREARTREEIGRAVRAFRSVDSLDRELREARADLESALDALAGLDVNRAVIAEALGITEGTLARRLPRKRKSPRTSTASRRAQVRPSGNTEPDVF